MCGPILLDEDHAARAGLCGEAGRQREGCALSGRRRARDEGMKEMSKKFIDMGAEVYVDKAQAGKEANNTL
jgi:hypothetical protein